VIDILDVAGFLNAGKFDGGTPARWADGDFNYDAVIDILDAAEFMTTGYFDAGPYAAAARGVAAVPEPHAGWFAAGGAVLLLATRRSAARRRGCISPESDRLLSF